MTSDSKPEKTITVMSKENSNGATGFIGDRDMPGLAAVTEEDLTVFAMQQADRLHVPGYAISVFDRTRAVQVLGGITSIEDPLPITPSTLFRVASLTKPLVATAVVLLHVEGLLDLDTPIRKYLPEFRLADKLATDQVTLRQVLSHTGGWDDLMHAGDVASLDEAIASLGRCHTLAPPGGAWSYCNSGFVVAGRVLEVVAASSFERVISDLLLEPLDMADSTFNLGEIVTRRVAQGHFLKDGAQAVVHRWDDPLWGHPSVGLATSLQDMTKFIRAHANPATGGEGRPMVSPEALRLTHAPQTDDRELGLPWHIAELGGTTLITHGGNMLGCGSFVGLVPAMGCGFVILDNSGGHAFDRAMNGWLTRRMFRIQDRVRGSESEPSALREYEGTYVGSYQTLHVYANGGGLMISTERTGPGPGGTAGQPPPAGPRQTEFYGRDRIVESDPERNDVRGRFLRGSDGAISMLRFPSVLHRMGKDGSAQRSAVEGRAEDAKFLDY
jgi:CubicO group peptidase (beta-lactamase class C family)